MNKYLLHGKLTAKEGSGEKLTANLLLASESVSTVKGCIAYVVSKDAKDKNSVWVTEIWETKEDHNSLKNESVRKLIMETMPILDGQPLKGQELEVLGGKGV
jgi:quinol monooxygenase YgiN